MNHVIKAFFRFRKSPSELEQRLRKFSHDILNLIEKEVSTKRKLQFAIWMQDKIPAGLIFGIISDLVAWLAEAISHRPSPVALYILTLIIVLLSMKISLYFYVPHLWKKAFVNLSSLEMIFLSHFSDKVRAIIEQCGDVIAEGLIRKGILLEQSIPAQSDDPFIPNCLYRINGSALRFILKHPNLIGKAKTDQSR